MSTPSPLKLIIIFLSSLLPLTSTSAANPLDIVINEIAWMGTEKSYNDEWIEFYNNSSSLIEMNGWKLKSEDGIPDIVLKGKIPPKGFFLLERTDDTTLSNVKADLIYKGSLNNKGEYLKLINPKGKMIDEINCSDSWFEGDNETKRTMERKNILISGNDPKNWQTSQNTGGTPKSKNSQGEEKNQAKEASTKEELALASEQIPKSSKSFFTFLTALIIAISSGIIVLFLKKRIKTEEE